MIRFVHHPRVPWRASRIRRKKKCLSSLGLNLDKDVGQPKKPSHDLVLSVVLGVSTQVFVSMTEKLSGCMGCNILNRAPFVVAQVLCSFPWHVSLWACFIVAWTDRRERQSSHLCFQTSAAKDKVVGHPENPHMIWFSQWYWA